LAIAPEKLLNTLSYSHFELLLGFDDPLKRVFYEIECIRGNWSVRELKRQIGSFYCDRSGLSQNKEKPAELVSGQVNFVGICKGTARRAPTKNQAPVPANFVLTAH
jgi:hypothetical protein